MARQGVKPVSKPVHCEECSDRDYVPPSPKALASLMAGLESARKRAVVYRREDFARYADDE